MKLLGILTILLLVSCGFQSHASDEKNPKNMKQAQDPAQQVTYYAPGELLLKFSDAVPEALAKQRLADQGAFVIKLMKQQGVYHIRLPKGQDAQEQLASYRSIEGIEFVELNYTRGLK